MLPQICETCRRRPKCAPVLRSVTLIVSAIQISQPTVLPQEAAIIAESLHHEAVAHDFDPLTGVSIIFHESELNPNAISSSGEDYDLAQFRACYIGACKRDADPLNHPSRACLDVKRSLLKPEYKIRTMAELITRNRKSCKKKVGSARFSRWLESYQGRNNSKKKRYCRPGPGTWRVIEFRTYLISTLRKRGFKA